MALSRRSNSRCDLRANCGVLGRRGTQGLRTMPHLRPMKAEVDQC
jgi:hypothetical protein